MAKRISHSFSNALRKEVRLIHREIVDGCNDCKGLYRMCSNHHAFFNRVCADPKKYIELTKSNDGTFTTKRLFDLTNVEAGGRPVKLIL